MKLAYFKFSEVDKMNELLSKTRIASGAKPFVSQAGEFIIPYEDGLPPTNAQLAMQLAEMRNGYIQERELLSESLTYLSTRLERNNTEIASISGIVDEKGRSLYKNNQRVDQLENENKNYEATITVNNEELTRLNLNIELLEARMKELQG